MNTIHNKNRTWLILLSVSPLLSFSQGVTPEGDTYFSNALFNTLLGTIIFLLIILVVLTQSLKNIAQSDFIIRQQKEKKGESSDNPAKTAGIILFCLMLFHSQGQAATGKWTVGGLDMFTFYFMAGVIFLEVVFLILLLHTLHYLLKTDKPKALVQPEKKKSLLEIMNASVDIEEEEDILMDHEYDGIRELDNDLPPWWRYGFYLTIFVGVIYLINYHVAHTGDLQIAEYNKEIEKGKEEVSEYMKKAANNVDETNIKMLAETADLESGKENFINTCAACHGKLGEGGVGPNLTDEYWMHGGSLPDIFKSIKYGWPDKGMKSWKEDFSPIQMAQLTSFIRTLKGTNPPKGKPQQGDLYVEKNEASKDSLTNPADSLQLKSKLDSLTADGVQELKKK